MTTRICGFILLTGLSAFAQWGGEQTRTANIRGGGGRDGKCTIEVEVDDVAEVEIRGTMARLRTRQGQRAAWHRFECNQPMPTRPYDFRFRGIDGRGRQDLVRDPSNGGVAVIRIEDRKGGREAYTFDIMWRGGADGGRYRDDRYQDDRYRDDRYRDDRYRDDRYRDDRYRDDRYRDDQYRDDGYRRR